MSIAAAEIIVVKVVTCCESGNVLGARETAVDPWYLGFYGSACIGEYGEVCNIGLLFI